MDIEYQLKSLEDRIQIANEHDIILLVLEDAIKIVKDIRCTLSHYLSILNALVKRLHPSLLLTEAEYHENFFPIFTEQSSRETLVYLINSLSKVSKSENYKFEKLLQIVEHVLQNKLKSILCSTWDSNGQENFCQMQFTRALVSFPDRIFKFFESDNSKLSTYSRSSANAIIIRFQTLLIDAITFVLHRALIEFIDIDLCSVIVADLMISGTEIVRQFLFSMLKKNSSVEWTAVYQKLFLSEHIEFKRHEQILTLLVYWVWSSDELFIIFGDAVVKNNLLKNVLTRRILLERPQNSFQDSYQLVTKVAGYLALTDKELISQTFLNLLQVWSDQAKLIHVTNFQQQIQLSVALIVLAKKIDQHDRQKITEFISPLLLGAVPEYLKLVDANRRQMGMLLAETLINWFKCSDKELHFDFNEEDEMFQQFKSIIKDSPTSALSNEKFTMACTTGPSIEKKSIKIESTILDSDDDDIPGCDKTFVESIESYVSNPRNRPNYLRVCYDQLAEKEDYKKFAAALIEISRLIRTRSVGFDDLALQLMERLLFLENRFNMPNFMALKKEAMELCFVNRPELVSFAVRIMFSQNCSMHERYFILESMEGAAKRLSEQKKEIKKRELDDKEDSIIKVGTVIRKSTQKPMECLSFNAFNDIAPQFIYPLLNVKEIGSHLKVDNIDEALLGKILLTISKMLIYAKNSPSLIRITSTLLPILYSIRQNQNSFVIHGCLYTYAAIVEIIPETVIKSFFETEILDWINFCGSLMESKHIESDPTLKHSIDFTLNKIMHIVNK